MNSASSSTFQCAPCLNGAACECQQATAVSVAYSARSGRTHLASAIGIEAVQRHGKRVRYFSTVELTNALELEKATGKQGQIAHKLRFGGNQQPNQSALKSRT